MSRRSVLITGAGGGIGTAVALAFAKAGWTVVGAGLGKQRPAGCAAFVEVDLARLAVDDGEADRFRRDVLKHCTGGGLDAIINNAAVQHLAPTGQLTADAWRDTMDINITAPFRLVQAFLPELKAARGVILNMGSVHAQATKPEFVAYATSKAALHGLTRALAVDLGPDVRAICLAPAAVSTPMLQAGFEGRETEFKALEACHPVGRIAHPGEVAEAALFLVSSTTHFISGSTFWLDGGVLSRLHDPV
jgi:NAD(P)-dependent dehydrogenase (short-subunit alcohol dehydrogenase family)